jgi:hypothetical protein
MEPGLEEGSWALLLPTRGRMPRVGDVVVAEHPGREGFELVKRVAAISSRRRLVWLAGDNRGGSTDSEEFGPVAVDRVVGRVVLRLRPGPPRVVRRDPSRLWN